MLEAKSPGVVRRYVLQKINTFVFKRPAELMENVVAVTDYIRARIQRYKDHGIKVEGTILLGTDDHDEDSIKRLVDFLLEVKLDLAEFTVLTPFPHTRTYEDLEKQGRILHKDWRRYTAGEVVFQPAKMSIDKLQELYHYAWSAFYKDAPHALKMGRVLKQAMRKEEAWGTKGRFAADGEGDKKFGKALER